MEQAAKSLNVKVHLQAPSRLHFGLLAFGDRRPRGYGGAGVMIQEPGVVLEASYGVQGIRGAVDVETSRRLTSVLQSVQRHTRLTRPVEIRIHRSANRHQGLGSGTQLSLSVACAVAELADVPYTARDLACWTRRGERSAVGIHGFARGGLILDGGRGENTRIAPLLTRVEFPDWPILLIHPTEPNSAGRHGEDERSRMIEHPPVPAARYDRLARLLFDLVAAAADGDHPAFADALFDYNRLVGECYAYAQEGCYSSPVHRRIVDRLREAGISAVGQSSWGPTLFAICADQERLEHAKQSLNDFSGSNPLRFVETNACNQGAVVRKEGAL